MRYLDRWIWEGTEGSYRGKADQLQDALVCTEQRGNHFQGGACDEPRSVLQEPVAGVVLDAPRVPSGNGYLGGS